MVRFMSVVCVSVAMVSGAANAQSCDPRNPHIWNALTAEQISEKGLGKQAISLSEAFIEASKTISHWDVSLVITDCPFEGYEVRSRFVFKGVPAAHIKPRYALYMTESTLRKGSDVDLARTVRKQICLMKTGIVAYGARDIDNETPPVTRCMIDFAVANKDEDYEGWLRAKLAMAGPEIGAQAKVGSDLDQRIKSLEGMPNVPLPAIEHLKRFRDSLKEFPPLQ